MNEWQANDIYQCNSICYKKTSGDFKVQKRFGRCLVLLWRSSCFCACGKQYHESRPPYRFVSCYLCDHSHTTSPVSAPDPVAAASTPWYSSYPLLPLSPGTPHPYSLPSRTPIFRAPLLCGPVTHQEVSNHFTKLHRFTGWPFLHPLPHQMSGMHQGLLMVSLK